MVMAVAPEVGLDLTVPSQLLMAAADTLPGWLRQETLGSPTLSSYRANRQELGIWEFRAGRGYFELEYHPLPHAGRRDRIELAVRVIDGAVFAGVRLDAIAPNSPLDPEIVNVIASIDAHADGLIAAALLEQLHEIAAAKGRGMKTVDPIRTRRLFMQLQGGAS